MSKNRLPVCNPITEPTLQPISAPITGMSRPKENSPGLSIWRLFNRLRPADSPISSRNRHKMPVKGVTTKGAIISMPLSCVTAPITKAPASSTTEPFANNSRAGTWPLARSGEKRCAIHSAERIAGTSMLAATATM